MTEIAFTVYGKPEPAGSKRAFQNRQTGRIVITDANAKAKPWKATVVAAAVDAMNSHTLITGPVHLEITFNFIRPKSHIGVKGDVRASAPAFPAVKPDLLKLARGVEDALTGIAYRDDAQIVTETLHKTYTTGQAHTLIRLVPVNTTGALTQP